MFAEILRKPGTDVQPKSEEFSDSYEDLIAKMHEFLDRLVAESKTNQDIFIDGGDSE